MALLGVAEDASVVYVRVDDAAFTGLSSYSWKIHRNREGVPYPRRWDRVGRRWIYMHVQVWRASNNDADPRPLQVDHADTDTLNCESGNLRLATRSQNAANRRRKSTAVNPFRGVSPVRGGRFQARIRVQRKLKVIGTYNDAITAAQAYDAEARVQFGQFARTNF